MKTIRMIVSLFLIAIFYVGCIPPAQHRQAIRDSEVKHLSAGKVQREIHVGMTNAEVAEILGSPNIVTLDENHREVWIYDKIATKHAYSNSSASLLGLSVGVAPGFSENAGASSTSQQTLTIIVKFDEQKKVRDFGYRQSSF
jgi:outer membrane protein assembly factor BamE (lipoprotein component of BamABCDE complex)